MDGRVTSELMTIALHCGVLVAGAIAFVAVARRRFRLGWFVAALGLYAIYDLLLTRGAGLVPNLIGEDWNWTGKLMSTTGMLVVASLPFFGWRNVGLTTSQRQGALSGWAALLVLCAIILYFAVATGDGRPDDAETIAFQWTMPGIDEELFYRGVLLLALNEAFRGKFELLGAPIGWGGILTCLIFGAAHGLGWHDGNPSFDAPTFAMTGGPAFILPWLREKTGSIIAPVIGHNVVNGAFTLF